MALSKHIIQVEDDKFLVEADWDDPEFYVIISDRVTPFQVKDFPNGPDSLTKKQIKQKGPDLIAWLGGRLGEDLDSANKAYSYKVYDDYDPDESYWLELQAREYLDERDLEDYPY